MNPSSIATLQSNIATSTTFGAGVMQAMFNTAFDVIRSVLPYVIGFLVFSTLIYFIWRAFRHIRA